MKVTVDVGDGPPDGGEDARRAVQARAVAVAVASGIVVTLAGAMPALWRGSSLTDAQLWTLRGLLALAAVVLVIALALALAAARPAATGDEPLARPGGTSRDVLVAAAERAATDLRRREAVLHAAAVLFAFALAALAAQGVLLAFAG